MIRVRPEYARLLDRAAPVLRWRYPLLVVAAFAFSLQHLRGTGGDWRWFVKGSELLFGTHHPSTALAGGFHLYAHYPEVQIGPLSLLLATPFRLLGRTDGRIVASLLLTAVAPALVFILERTAVAVWHDADRRLVALSSFMGGLLVVQAWSPLATIYARLDDVLLLGALTVALWAVAHRRLWLASAMLGVGMALKPWGIVALPLVLALPPRYWWRATAVTGAITAVAWLPFVVADPSTLSAMRPQALTSPASVLGLFGVPFADAPLWVRPVQFGAALLLGAVAVTRGRWAAVPLVGIALRVGLDPEVWLYYSTGLLLAALAWDLLRSPQPLPVWTVACFLMLDVAYVAVSGDHQRAVLRLVLTAAVVVGVTVGPRRAGPVEA